LVSTTDDSEIAPVDPTRFFVHTAPQNRYFGAPVEKVGLEPRINRLTYPAANRYSAADADIDLRSAGRRGYGGAVEIATDQAQHLGRSVSEQRPNLARQSTMLMPTYAARPLRCSFGKSMDNSAFIFASASSMIHICEL